MKNILFILLFLFTTNSMFGQSKKINCSVIDFFIPSYEEFKKQGQKKQFLMLALHMSDYEEVYTKVGKIQSYVLEKLVKDRRFNLVERSKLNLIARERELQKSEEFIDGYVTEQGKAIGTDYLVLGDFELSSMVMTISVYSVADDKLVASEIVKLKNRLNSNFLSIKDPIDKATDLLVEKFAPNYITLLEITSERKSSAKKALIAGGLGFGLEEGDKIELKIEESKEVNGEVLTYFKTIGLAKVDQIEDENFSIISIKSGGKSVYKVIDSGKKVFCKRVIK